MKKLREEDRIQLQRSRKEYEEKGEQVAQKQDEIEQLKRNLKQANHKITEYLDQIDTMEIGLQNQRDQFEKLKRASEQSKDHQRQEHLQIIEELKKELEGLQKKNQQAQVELWNKLESLEKENGTLH